MREITLLLPPWALSPYPTVDSFWYMAYAPLHPHPRRERSCLSLMSEHQAAGRAFFYHLCRARGRVADSDLARFAHVLGAYIADSDAEPNDQRDPDVVSLQNGTVGAAPPEKCARPPTPSLFGSPSPPHCAASSSQAMWPCFLRL